MSGNGDEGCWELTGGMVCGWAGRRMEAVRSVMIETVEAATEVSFYYLLTFLDRYGTCSNELKLGSVGGKTQEALLDELGDPTAD